MERKKLVLVADDSRTSRALLCSIVEKEGFSTVQAENGIDAIKIVAEHTADFLILDLLMPEMDGFEVLKDLNEKNISIPTIVLTADIQDEVREECFELGARGFVNKPFSESELCETIRSVFK